MIRALTVVLAALTVAGCALRPRYAQFVTRETRGPAVALQLVENGTGAPVAGATVEIGELKSRVSVKTDGHGRFALPVEKKYLDENPMLVVNAPAGIWRTEVVAAPVAAPLPAPVLAEPVAPPPVAPPPVESTVDAGT